MPALAFIDESGDAGMDVEGGASPFFTVAVVIFESPETAVSCQQAIQRLRERLRLSPRAEFKFHSDSHQRRLEVLGTLGRQPLAVSSVTLDKAAAIGRYPPVGGSAKLYSEMCGFARAQAGAQLDDARVVMDGRSERQFRNALAGQLKRQVASGGSGFRSLALKRSTSDPLLQVADYFAGVANRAPGGKAGAEDYLRLVESRFVHREIRR